MQAWAESMLRGLHCLQPTVRPRTYANVVSIGLGLDHVEWRSLRRYVTSLTLSAS